MKTFNKKCCILIPARGGSKGIPGKNLIDLNGRPLIYYALKAAIDSNIKDIWVSTDSDKISKYCQIFSQNGVKIIKRPKEISGDLSTDLEAFEHFLSVNRSYDYLIHLRPTFPLIDENIINNANSEFLKNYDKYDSLRSMIKGSQNPYKMWHIDDKLKYATTVVKKNELHSSPRQLAPMSYIQNACIDIVKKSTILDKKSMVGTRCMPFVMGDSFSIDIDTFKHLKEAKDAIRSRNGK